MTVADEIRAMTDQGLIGHSRAAHRVHGWCSVCKGREVWEEALAWRVQSNKDHDKVEEPAADRIPPTAQGAPGG